MSEKSKSLKEKVSYRDSRRAAFRVLQPGITHGPRRFLTFIAVAAAVWFSWNFLACCLSIRVNLEWMKRHL